MSFRHFGGFKQFIDPLSLNMSTPDPYSFGTATNIAFNATADSSVVTITGLMANTNIIISANNGFYGAGSTSAAATSASFTSANGSYTTDSNGQLFVKARGTAGASYGARTTVIVTIGTGTGYFFVYATVYDTTPNTPWGAGMTVTSAAVSTAYNTGLLTLNGMQTTYPIVISCTGGTVDAGTTTLSGTPSANKTVTTSVTGTLVLTAYLNTGTAYGTANNCVITVGTVTQTFSVTTLIVVADAPTIGTATVLLTTATVPFTAPTFNGGSAITGYTATSSPGGFTGTLAQAGNGSITVSGLTKNTAYTFTVTATNAIGTGSASAASNSITALGVANAPTIGTATVSGSTATVPFTAPLNNGGSIITSYTATSSPGGFTGTLNQAGNGSITVSGLTKNTAYTFTVTATNAIGTSSASAASNSITALGVADAPTIGTATVLLTTATVPFTAPLNNGGSIITSYTATSSPGNLTGTLAQAGNGSITVSGLTKNTAYTFTVTATNAIGTGSASAASNSITAQGVANAPTIGTATVSGSTATVPFTAPLNNGGSIITSYTATSSPGGFTGTLNQAGNGSITVSGLTKNTAYTFTVTATNAIGTGSASAASNSITAQGVADAPIIGTVIVYGVTVGVPFTAPTNNGGNAITIYTATSSPGNLTGTLSQAGSGAILVTGLTAGTAYTFTVTATNAIGTSSASTASNSITAVLLDKTWSVGVLGGDMYGVTVNSSGLFVAVGYDYTNSYPYYATSTDGLTWTTPATMNGSTTYAQMRSVTVNSSGLFVAVGYGGGGYPMYATSTNGSNWTTPATMNGSTTYANMQSVTVNSSGLFVAVGYNINIWPLYATSTNGSNWTTPAYMNNTQMGMYMLGVTVNSSGLFVAVGCGQAWTPAYAGETSYALYATSTNGSTWTTPTTMSSTPTRGYMQSVTVNSSGLFVAVGYNPDNSYGICSTSTNGSTWTTPLTLTNRVTYLNSVTVNSNGLFVTVGNDYYTWPQYITSTDGTTWSSQGGIYTGGGYARSVTVSKSGLFVEVGSTYAATLITVPNAPTIGTATVSGSTATVPFTAPTLTGGSVIIMYTATSSPGGFTGTLNQAGNGSITVSGLTKNTAYTFTVTATNAAGTSSASAASNSITAQGVADAPTIGTATVLLTTATVPFTAPLTNGGSIITSYTATSSPGNLTGTLNQAGNGSITVSGLTKGTAYTFTVTATNAIGTSSASAASNSVTAHSINAAWTTPALMNGSTVAAQMYGVTVNSSGLFVAVGYYSFPAYATSINGSTWTTPAAMNNSSVYAYMKSVTVNSSGLFVAVGNDDFNYPLYATSTNGSNWTTPARMNGSSAVATMHSVTVNSSGLFVAVGWHTDNNYPLYATSTNGSNWITPASMNSSAAAIMQSVTVNSSGLFVAVGYSGTPNFYPLYATSTNGSNWTTPARMNGSTTHANIQSVTVNSSGLFVAVGETDSPTHYPLYATSTNGSNWTTPALMNGSTTHANIQSVTVDSSGLFVAVGWDVNSAAYATSTNGSDWTTPKPMSGSGSGQMHAVTVNSSGLFVAVGKDSYYHSLYATSTFDGPTTIGQSYGGGFYAGKINDSGIQYYLVVAPKATGENSSRTWGTYGVTTGITSVINGLANTTSLNALGAAYQAAQYCVGLNAGAGLNGYTDWYLPAKNEIEVLYYFLKPTTRVNDTSSGSNANAVSPEPISTNYTSGSPAQTSAGIGFRTGETDAFATGFYWSSTETSANLAWALFFYDGGLNGGNKISSSYVRAVRRIAV